MTVLRRSRRLAQAGGAAILIRSHVAVGWGYNGEGQLGDGTIISRSGFGDIRVANDVVQVAAGSGHGLAVRSDGTVWAWGFNGAGKLGDGTTTSRSTPVRVTGLSGVTQVAACSDFSVALRSDGTVWAWGDNRGGQLGRGTMSNHEVTPARVRGLARVTKISAGGSFVLALRSDGTVRAWGDNRRGQLGNGTTASSPVPVKVAGLSGVTGISAGYDARRNGTVWTARLKSLPVATCVALVRPVTCTGPVTGAVLPLPSWPKALLPQASTVPSGFSASRWNSPAES